MSWVPLIYTGSQTDETSESHDAGAKVTVDARSVMVLRSEAVAAK